MISGFSFKESLIAPEAFISGILSGICFALNSIFLRFATRRGIDPVVCSFYSALMTMSALLPFGRAGEMACAFIRTPSILLPSIGVAFISTLIPSVLYNRALTMIETGKASMLSYVEPVVSCLIGVLLFAEILTLQSVAGIMLILVGMFVLNRQKKQTAHVLNAA